MIGSKIEKTCYYLPEKILSNYDIEKLFPEWEASKVEIKVGIKNRHIAAENESALDMGIKVSMELINDTDKKEIDYVIFCTQSPEYYLPSGACLIQHKLGLRNDIGALDINLGCSGYVYGLSLADSVIKAGHASKVLLITSETYTKHIHPQDKSNMSIFGDASTATIIGKSENDMILKFVLGTDGSGFNKLIVKNGAFNANNEDKTYEKSEFPDEYIYMNGPDIFNFTIDIVPTLVGVCLNKNKLVLNDIDMFIFHQANKFILDFLRQKLKIPKEKFYINLWNTGNTVSSTLPIALKQCIDEKLIQEGSKVMLVGFGVGLSWAATIVEI
ncbi:MAG: ketoacyl-ACP synthase III [Saprospiraceae bacterium]|nr:ketoacyl-ACP synthase III [Saprospiraceae bacterium]